MGADVKDSWAVGSGPPDFRKFLQDGGSSNLTFWRGELGDVPSDREDPGWVTTQGGLLSGKNES